MYQEVKQKVLFIVRRSYKMELGSDLEGHESDTVSLATEGGEMPALLYLLDLL